MLIVTITRSEPSVEGQGYRRDREVFRYEAEDLDIPALVRATLDADVLLKLERAETARLLAAVRDIDGGQYCTEGCERTAARVVRAALRGEPRPVCTGHAPDEDNRPF